MRGLSVIVPAYNEEKNIEKVINCIKKNKLVNEIIVINNNSTDRTEEIAKSLGVQTLLCKKQGKGYAMEYGLKHAKYDFILFADGDIANYKKDFIDKMINPLLYENFDFVKSTFERNGGRVTELVAKPLLELTFPKLKKFSQPLSGIIAGKKSKFNQITFDKDYGVDIGILIDMYKLKCRMIEVNIGKIKNDSQDWRSLTKMSQEVSKAILKRKFSKKIKVLDDKELMAK